jgi:DNA processing protein
MTPPSSELLPDVRDRLALHLVPGIGPRLTAALLERFGSARAALSASRDQLQQVPHIGPRLAERLSQSLHTVNVEAELESMTKHGVHLLARETSGYPDSLVNIPCPPDFLYVRGALAPADTNAIAIVGSRSCTSYGRRIAERMSSDLARAGFTVVSGLARGIDGCVHRATLLAGGRTLAVLAGGLARIYPPEHAELADQVAAQGALLSEAAMLMEPMATMFPARNRIISGLSRGVIVIEAAERSGALITASHAAEQGRPVFAVPGQMDSPASAGVHQLVRKGAILIRGVEDILEELNGVRPNITAKTMPAPELDPEQQRVWVALSNQQRPIDALVQELALPVERVTGLLFMMEMKKLVRRLPGNCYERRQ